MLFVLVMYMEVVLEPNTVSDAIKVFLDDPQWPEHIKDPQLKQSNITLFKSKILLCGIIFHRIFPIYSLNVGNILWNIVSPT